jgi:hypothetical protein
MGVACMAQRRGQRYRAMVVKSVGKRLLGRHMHIWWDKVR